MRFVGRVNDSRYDFGVNFVGRFQKRRLDIVRRLGRRFQKEQAVLIGKGLSFLCRDGAAVLQVVLVANEQNDHVFVRVLLGLLQPPAQVLEGVAAGNVVDEQRAGGAAVVAAGDAAEGLLPRRVPNLQFDHHSIVVTIATAITSSSNRSMNVVRGAAAQRDHARPEFDANRQIVNRLKALVCELQQQAGLSHTW